MEDEVEGLEDDDKSEESGAKGAGWQGRSVVIPLCHTTMACRFALLYYIHIVSSIHVDFAIYMGSLQCYNWNLSWQLADD